MREALVQPERTGLVTREALKGHRVAPPPDHDQLGGLFDARIMLGETAARLAARETASWLDELCAEHRSQGAAGTEVLGAGQGSTPAPLPVAQRYSTPIAPSMT